MTKNQAVKTLASLTAADKDHYADHIADLLRQPEYIRDLPTAALSLDTEDRVTLASRVRQGLRSDTSSNLSEEERFAMASHVELLIHMTQSVGSSLMLSGGEEPPPVQAVRHSLADELKREIPQPKWVVEHVLAQGAITTVAGFIGAGKTPLILQLISSIQSGTPFLGFEVCCPKDLRIAYLTQEADYTFLPAAAKASLEGREEFGIYYWHENIQVPWDEMVAQAVEDLQGNGVLIVDVMLDWSGAKDENDAATMTEAYRPLVAAAGSGLAVLAVGHTPKPFDAKADDDITAADARGSGAVVGNSTIVLLYKQPKNTALRRNTRYFRFGRSRFGIPQRVGFYVVRTDTGLLEVQNDLNLAVVVVAEKQLRVTDAVTAVIDRGEIATKEAVRKQASMAKKVCEHFLESLTADGVLRKEGAGKKGDPIHYRIVDMPDS